MTDAQPNSLVQQLLSRIEDFTEEELIHLNRVIVERLRIMQSIRNHNAMIQFRVGQRVKFTANDGRLIVGMLTKYNRKSVTVVTNDGGQWNVAASLLKQAQG